MVGEKMKFGSLFAGIGGFDLGLERAGMKCAWQVEIDDYANKVLEKHWPDVKQYRDVRECGAHNLEPVDLICGGFPCQPHSLAGKRMASSDERDLWGEFARIICELRPRFVVAENVPGLLSSESGRFFGRVLRDLASSGYDCEWECIPASAIGAPHRRDRVWIVAHSNGKRRRIQSIKPPECENTSKFEHDGQEESVANSASITTRPLSLRDEEAFSMPRDSGADVPDSNSSWELQQKGLEQVFGEWAGNSSWWKVEPDVGRVVNGIPHRMDRLKCLGNTVVPQLVEWIGRRILKVMP